MNETDESKRRYEAFVIELEALLRKHKLMLSPSSYDWIDVSNLPEGGDPIYQESLRNCIE